MGPGQYQTSQTHGSADLTPSRARARSKSPPPLGRGGLGRRCFLPPHAPMRNSTRYASAAVSLWAATALLALSACEPFEQEAGESLIEPPVADSLTTATTSPTLDAPPPRNGTSAVEVSTTAVTPPAPADLAAERLARAQAAGDAGEQELALSLFRELLAHDPTMTTAYVGIGDIYMNRRDYARAEPAYARAARLSPHDFHAHYGRGLALQMLDRLDEAAQAYYGALMVQPANFNANANLATVYLQMDKPRSAVIFAQKAVEIDPTDGPSRANLGTAYEKISRFGDAAEQYMAAMELLDDATPVMMSLMRALGEEGRFREAAEIGERLVKMAPSAKAYERLGWCYFRLGQPDRSIGAYRSAIEIDPDHWPALNGVGINALNTWLLSAKNDRAAADEARQTLRRSLQINPEQPRVIVLLSNYGL